MNCSSSSAYVATDLVNDFHAIPHVDIDLNDVSSDFRLSIDYFEAVVIWACIPILIIVCLFILTTVYLICVCCCCCCQQHDKRSKGSKVTCGVLISILVFLILAMVGVAFWAEYALNQNINAALASANTASNTIEDIDTSSAAFMQNSTLASLSRLRETIEDNDGDMTALDAVTALDAATPVLAMAFAEVGEQVTVGSPTPSDVVNAVESIELVRHWVVIAYLIVVAILLLLFATTIWCGCCCRNIALVILMVIVFFFVTLLMWVAVGASLALQVVSADICSDPDSLIRNLTSNAINPESSLIPDNVVDYFLVCNETCAPSPYQGSIDEAEMTLDVIMGEQNTLMEYASTASVEVGIAFANLSSELDIGFDSFNTLVNLTMCEVFNTEYLSVLDNLCGDGYLHSVVLFSMACASAVCLFLLIICGTFHAGLLARGKEYDDETVVYDFPGGQGNSTWASYGTQGQFQTGAGNTQYTPFRESINMNASPTAVADPPKYGELQHGFNTGDGLAEEQPISNNNQRPGSGNYDHFDT